MKNDRKNLVSVLMDLKYKFSLNHFEEIYGDNVHYSDIEQESYIELKEMVFEMVCNEIKFKKYNRNNNILMLKVEMLEPELEELKLLVDDKIPGKRLNFMHNFCITNIRMFTQEEEDFIKNKMSKKESPKKEKNIEKDILKFIDNYEDYVDESFDDELENYEID